MSGAPAFSVVVASFRDLGILTQCLRSVGPQCEAAGAELIVVRRACAPIENLGSLAANCRVVSAPPDAGLPRLRGMGLAAASGTWVALTEDHCIADPGWLPALIDASGPDADVLGGSMGNAQRARATDCGAFFAEYGFYGGKPRGATPAGPPLIAQANAAYNRRVLADVSDWALQGAWEDVIHDRLHAKEYRFRLVPSARVRQNLHYHLASFCRERFAHGRDYAAARVLGRSVWQRALFAAATPVLPFLLASRIARAAEPEERMYFRRALPATITFLTAWAMGEAVGYLRTGPAQ